MSETQGLLNFAARLCSQHTSWALLGCVFHLPRAREPVLRKILHPSEFSLPSQAWHKVCQILGLVVEVPLVTTFGK